MVSNNKKRWMEKLQKHPGAVVGNKNIHADVISSNSPSLNFCFGKGQGLPRSLSVLLYGPPRGGKTVLAYDMAGNYQKSHPDAWVIKYNTEFREALQNGKKEQAIWGIDPERYMAIETNDPEEIYNHITGDLLGMIDEGMDVALIIIDSINGIQGRRAKNAGDVGAQQVGDSAATNQVGLAQILPVIRRRNIAMIVTAQIRAQIEQGSGGLNSVVHTSQKSAVRPGVSYAVQHFAEYYMYVAPISGADGKLIDKSVTDLKDQGDQTGHRIRVKMTDASGSPKNRVGELTLDYSKGIINVHEEVLELGLHRGIITKPSTQMYALDGMEWRSREGMLTALRESPELQKKVLTELKRRDMDGLFDNEPAPVSNSNEIFDPSVLE